LIGFAVIGAFSSNSEEDNGPRSSSANNRPPKRATAETKPTRKRKSGFKKGPHVRGTWDGECNQFSAGDLEACQKLSARNVTCQWIDNDVHMQVTFRNGLDAHNTVHLEPKYRLKSAGEHGEGITNVEDVGIDPGGTRRWETDLDPAGIDDKQQAITACTPTLDVLQGVELG